MRGAVTISDVSTLSRSPRPMLVKDSEDGRWQNWQKIPSGCDGIFIFFWFGHTPTSNLSFLACQMPFPALRYYPTYQKNPTIKEEHSGTLTVKVLMFSDGSASEER
jgi:hypothetical protein